MTAERLPDKQGLIRTLTHLINMHPIKPIQRVSLVFIYMGLLDQYPDIVSYSQFTAISKRKRTPEQIAEAMLLIWKQPD